MWARGHGPGGRMTTRGETPAHRLPSVGRPILRFAQDDAGSPRMTTASPRMTNLTRSLFLLCLAAAPLAAQQEPPRAIRRTVPITRSFEAGLKAGTRDSTGRPGAKYWQFGTDYKIDVRLDQLTGRLTGREVVTIRNPSDSAHQAARHPSLPEPVRPDEPPEPGAALGHRGTDALQGGGGRRRHRHQGPGRRELDHRHPGDDSARRSRSPPAAPPPSRSSGPATFPTSRSAAVPRAADGAASASSSWPSGIPRWRSSTTCADGIASRTWAAASSTTTTAASM